MRSRLLSMVSVTSFALLLPLSGVGGCAPIDSLEPEPLLSALVEAGSAEEIGVLAFLNDPATTVELLDDDVRLDSRAARNLIERRDAAPFTSAEEVDAVSYVGSVALQKILDWALSNGWVTAAAGDRDGAILALVNHEDTDFALLDGPVGLDRRAARNIIDARPFVSVAQLDAVSYVGATALDLLAAFAVTNGYAGTVPGGSAPCAIISEVIEGSGSNNKALEIFNCGSQPLILDQVGICLVRNDDSSCSTSRSAGAGTLVPGAVWVMCRTRTGTVADPYQPLVDACQSEIGSAAIFNGDDRLMLFHDVDADGDFAPSETVLDTFGELISRPSDTIWAELGFRRCDLAPRTSGAFDVDAHYTRHGSSTYTHLGVPPEATCGMTAPLAAEGDPCLSTDYCEAGLRCFGIPRDGSSSYGRCVDITPIAGEGERCDPVAPCADGLICAGWTLFGEGNCNPQWMAGRWTNEVNRSIPDAPAGGISPWIVVEGLASVPVDIEVTIHLEHLRPRDLRITLFDPNGDSAVLWDRSDELADWSRSFVTTGISRDDEVNGRWSLRVEDLVTGKTGMIEEWTLFIVSRWD